MEHRKILNFNFISFKYIIKLLESAFTDGNDRILHNHIIPMSLKCLILLGDHLKCQWLIAK